MEAKNATLQSEIIRAYMDYVLIHNEQPKTVNSFAKNNNIEEQRFYELFTSFDSLEQSIFKIFFDNSHTILEKNEDYQTFNAKNKLLNFYYTFFKILTANRSYLIYVLSTHQSSLKSLKTLEHLKKRFINYITYLNTKTIDVNLDQNKRFNNRSLKESAWLQLLITIKFWLNDTSPSFENTNAFIDKSVKASFNVIDNTSLKTALHLSKFLYTERIQAS